MTKKVIKFAWMEVDSSKFSNTKIAKVIGGWIVANQEFFDGASGESLAMVFVPDPNHEWEF